VHFRNSLDWVVQSSLQQLIKQCVHHYRGTGVNGTVKVNDYLLSALFIQGPVVWDLPLILAQGTTFRTRSLGDCGYNMGFPAAAHLSSMLEPAELLLKEASTIEGSHGDLSPRLIAAGVAANITAELILSEVIKPRCAFVWRIDDFELFKCVSSYTGPHGLFQQQHQHQQRQQKQMTKSTPSYKNQEISRRHGNIFKNSTYDVGIGCHKNASSTSSVPILVSNRPSFTRMLEVFENAVPWAVRKNPDRYPFYSPRRASPRYAGIYARTSSHEWMDPRANPPLGKHRSGELCYPFQGP
jgi:Zn-finger nucleic acid-binding protein